MSASLGSKSMWIFIREDGHFPPCPSQISTGKKGDRAWLCRCSECGIEKRVRASNIRSEKSTKCSNCSVKRASELVCGHDVRMHGLRKHPLYATWTAMISRVSSPHRNDYHRYVGRGITVCAEWRDVTNFIEWIEQNLGPRPEGYSLDRINNDGNYEPGNVRWASKKEQAQNSTNCRISDSQVQEIVQRYKAGGVTQLQLASEYGVTQSTISGYIRGERVI